MKTQAISLSTSEKIGIIANLSTMLAAGIPILDAVSSLIEDARGNSKKLLEVLHDDLLQGSHVYMTFAKFPKVFNKVTINVIKASEEAGSLETSLSDLKDNIKKEAEFSDKIKSAMVYPTLIMFVFFGVLTMILVVVVPKIATVFGRLSVDLPLPTKVLIFVSNLLLQNTLVFLGGLSLTIVSLVFLVKKKKDLIFSLLSHLPVVSTLVREIDLTRFTRSLYLLLIAGLPITQALELAQDVIMKKSMVKMIIRSREMVLSGKTLSAGLRESKGSVPSLMIKLIEVGEKSGTLDKSLKDISEFLDYQVTNTLRTLTVLLEPIMLLFVGVCVGGMMLAIIAPIYGLIGQVGSPGSR